MIVQFLALLFAVAFALILGHGSARAQEASGFSQQQLDQMLAPVALYPDPLLSQILMAATYPLEVVEAARWSRNHSNLIGDDAVRAADGQNWDPSVKSLLAFPQVLERMDENLQWMQALGDAFLGQEPQVLDTVQGLRRRAHAAGYLGSNEYRRVVATGAILAIQPAAPQIVYVPYYDPMVVYGPRWWPDYRPFQWRPFAGYYVPPGIVTGFCWGPSIRISSGFFFGALDWSNRQVVVIRSNYYNAVVYPNLIAGRRDHAPSLWQHDTNHRRGVAYPSVDIHQRFAYSNARPPIGLRRDQTETPQRDMNPDTRVRAYPHLDRHSEPRREMINPPGQVAAARPIAPTLSRNAAPPAVQRQPVAGEIADRRDRGRKVDHVDPGYPLVRPPETRPIDGIRQREPSAVPVTRGDQAARITSFDARKSRSEARSESVIHRDLPRAAEIRPTISRPPAAMRPGAGEQERSSRSEKMAQHSDHHG